MAAKPKPSAPKVKPILTSNPEQTLTHLKPKPAVKVDPTLMGLPDRRD